MGKLTVWSYRAIFKRSPVLLLTAILGAVVFEHVTDYVSTEGFHRYNKGKLWDDIKEQYEKKEAA